MFELPATRLDDLTAYADWVELCALAEPDGTVSQADIAGVMRTSGLLGFEPTEVYQGDYGYETEHDFTVDDESDNFAELVWAVLELREKTARDHYPFLLEGDLLRRRADTWQDTLSYAHLLLTASIDRFDRRFMVERIDGVLFRTLFEKVVEAALSGVMRGTTVRFGSPPDPDWPLGFRERIDELGRRLELNVLQAEYQATGGDRGLDVASRLSMGDDGAGSVVFLAQCATGRRWREKRGEPQYSEWRDVLQWNACLVRVVAIPFWFPQPSDYASHFRRFDAVILDRPRLMSGSPDAALQEPFRSRIARWCDSQLLALPQLD